MANNATPDVAARFNRWGSMEILRRHSKALLVSGILVMLGGLGFALWAQDDMESWPNYQRLASLIPLGTGGLLISLHGFANWGAGDIRTNPSHFIQAHHDWRRFVGSNCTTLAAFGGGSNSSISDREAECHERELDQRIALYRQFADGTYGQ